MHDLRFPIIFTDLDGTLLDHHTYRFDAAVEALTELKFRSIPVILNTSKTAEESITLSIELDICHPVIVENGGAIVLPANYATDICTHQRATWHDKPTILTLGATREAISLLLLEANAKLLIDDCYRSFSSSSAGGSGSARSSRRSPPAWRFSCSA